MLLGIVNTCHFICEQFNEKHLIKEYHIFLHNEELSVICINIQEWMKNTYYKIEKSIGKVAQNGNQHTTKKYYLVTFCFITTLIILKKIRST